MTLFCKRIWVLTVLLKDQLYSLQDGGPASGFGSLPHPPRRPSPHYSMLPVNRPASTDWVIRKTWTGLVVPSLRTKSAFRMENLMIPLSSESSSLAWSKSGCLGRGQERPPTSPQSEAAGATTEILLYWSHYLVLAGLELTVRPKWP